jgi:hypothetical protein
MNVCITDGCQRATRRDPGRCEAHGKRMLTAAFGPRVVERRAVKRLSATDPFCVSVAETSRASRPVDAAIRRIERTR